MTVSTAVKWAVSSMTGAPTLNGTAGSMIALLDAFLVNGFGTKAVDSAQVTSGVCRLAITGGSATQDHCVIQLAGVTGDGVGLNGPQRVKAATASYVDFPCDLPDGPLTGTITFKIAPLGWEKVFSKTNVAVYRSTDPAGTRAYYRVDDTNALYARVTMYESMSDVDSGVGVAPSSPSGGFYWHKRNAAAATGVYWQLRGDSCGFYISAAPNGGSTAAASNGWGLYTYYAGDIQSRRPGDPWCGFLSGAVGSTYSQAEGCIFSSAVATGMVLQRGAAGLGSGLLTARRVMGGTALSGSDASLGRYPSVADNGLCLSPILIAEGDIATAGPRGQLPGAWHVPQTGAAAYFNTDGVILQGVGEFAGAALLPVACGGVAASGTAGLGFVDVVRPWRGA
jgi:hypothetical protein